MRITKGIPGDARPYEHETSNMTCPVCGLEVAYLVGDDEEVAKPDAGRRGCEKCWRPFKYSKPQSFIPPSPSQVFEQMGDVKAGQPSLEELKQEVNHE